MAVFFTAVRFGAALRYQGMMDDAKLENRAFCGFPQTPGAWVAKLHEIAPKRVREHISPWAKQSVEQGWADVPPQRRRTLWRIPHSSWGGGPPWRPTGVGGERGGGRQ